MYYWSTADLMYLVELLRVLIDLELVKLQHLIEFGMLVFFTYVSLIEFWINYLASPSLFSGIESFKWFWIGSRHKNGAPRHSILDSTLFLIYINDLPDDSICNIVTVSMLMILLYTLNEIRHLICGNNSSWLLNFNLTYKTLWTWAGSGFLISMLKKLNLFCFII